LALWVEKGTITVLLNYGTNSANFKAEMHPYIYLH